MPGYSVTRLEALRASTPDGKLPSFSWPGAYPIVYFTSDGLTVCPSCANDPDTSDPVTDGDVYWEGSPIPCDDCGLMIESAYGDPDAPDDPIPDPEPKPPDPNRLTAVADRIANPDRGRCPVCHAADVPTYLQAACDCDSPSFDECSCPCHGDPFPADWDGDDASCVRCGCTGPEPEPVVTLGDVDAEIEATGYDTLVTAHDVPEATTGQGAYSEDEDWRYASSRDQSTERASRSIEDEDEDYCPFGDACLTCYPDPPPPPDDEDCGPVVGPDGEPTDFTLAMLRGYPIGSPERPATIGGIPFVGRVE